MKNIQAFLISLFYQILILFVVGAKNTVSDFYHGKFLNPDSYYTMDLVYQHLYNGATLGSNPMILQSHLSWIHWSSLYLFIIDTIAQIIGVFFSSSVSIQFASSIVTFIPSLILGFAFVRWMQSYGASILTCLFFAGILFINDYISGYNNISSLTHHSLMICTVGLFILSTLRRKINFYLSGVLASLSLWVSPEIFPVVLSGLGIIAIRNESVTKTSLIWSISMLLIILIDPNPPTMPWYAPDRLDYCYLILGLFICISSYKFINKLYLLIAISISTSAWMLITPHLLQGIHGIIPQDIYKEWYRHVSEVAPIDLNLLFIEKMFIYLVIYGTMLFCSIKQSISKNFIYMYMLLIVTIYFVMGAFHGRSMLEFVLLISIFGFYAFKEIRVANHIYVKGFLYSILIGNIIFMICNPALRKDDNTCRINDLLVYINHKNTHVLSSIDEVPQILWNTKENNVKTFAGPYHRDVDSLQIRFRIFRNYKSSVNYLDDLELINKYSINYIVVCPKKMDLTEYFPWRHFDYFKGFLDSQNTNQLPKNIKKVSQTPSGWLIYQVK